MRIDYKKWPVLKVTMMIWILADGELKDEELIYFSVFMQLKRNPSLDIK